MHVLVYSMLKVSAMKMTSTKTEATVDYLIASDFDQTLSFNDSGHVLAEMLGISDFAEKVAGLARTSLVKQGAELAYLLRHDPAFRGVRREHLVEAGKCVRLKDNVKLLTDILSAGIDGYSFDFYVISAGPALVVRSALENIVSPEHVFGSELEFDANTGEISAITHVPAGNGKVTVLESLELKLQMSSDRVIYIGDGSSDLYVMHDVNSRDGHTIAVSETKSIGRIANRTVLSNNAVSVLVPILEDVLKWDSLRIRELFNAHGLALQDWDKIHTDWINFHN
jgi:HAD superfamily phosphoserine phosphatase-like hydrolase